MVCLHTYSESDNTLLSYGHLKYSNIADGRHLGFYPTGNGAVRSAVPENPTLEQTRSRSDDASLRYGRLKISKMAAGRHLEFDRTGNGAVGSAVPENPTLEPNTKSIG